MKKMVVIIVVLLVIFLGMLIYKKQTISNTRITAQEVEKIENYISKIYLWREITKDSLPIFEEINQAPDIWVWECVKNNLEQYELTKEEIEAKAKEIFGENFSKEFPKEGNESFIYNEERQKYIASNIELDNEEDSFLINKIQKEKNTYTVEITEYIEDYSNITETAKTETNEKAETEAQENKSQETENKACIKNLQEEIISTIENPDSETEAIDIVKNNLDKFTKKTITLEETNEDNLIVKSVKN